MDLGEPIREVEIIPDREPVPMTEPVEEPAPSREREREPEKVPA